MRDLLNLHIRALTEREDHPDTTQDLGTFVVWLLERHGFTVVMPPIKWKGTKVEVSKGDLQSGVDVRALRQEGDEVVLYRLVLKTGNMTPGQFANDSGTMYSDLWLAGGVDPSVDSNFTRGRIHWDRVVLVAVHNGDVGDKLQGQLKTLTEKLERQCEVRLEWWHAERLLSLALDPPAVPTSAADEDLTLFSPERRPFLRILLDNLSTQPDGTAFKLSDVERMLRQVFKIEPVPGKESTEERHFTLRVTELGLYLSMLLARAQQDAGGNMLPVLDTLERCLTRIAAECGTRSMEPSRNNKTLKGALSEVVELYLQTAEELARRLAPLMKHQDGLAIVSDSEPVDYPLRVLRLSGYLAVAAGVLLDRPKDKKLNRKRAQALAEALRELWRQNPGGALMPVADDQIIELALVWEVWLRLKMDDAVIESCTGLLERLDVRARFGLPMPLLWCRTGPEMTERELRALVYAKHYREELNQQASTIVPLALYLLKRLRPTEPLPGLKLPMVGQVWQPEADAPQRWYAEDLSHTGTSHLVEVPVLERRVGEVAMPLPESPAERWKLPALDRMAWKVHRNPPPLWGFIKLTER